MLFLCVYLFLLYSLYSFYSCTTTTTMPPLSGALLFGMAVVPAQGLLNISRKFVKFSLLGKFSCSFLANTFAVTSGLFFYKCI